jgi:hypothetical protein
MFPRALAFSASICLTIANSAVAQLALGAYAYGQGWGSNFASTPAEGYARGMADVIRAQGQAYESATRGAIAYEQARSAYIQNELLWQQTAQERQREGYARREQYYANQRALRDRRNAMADHEPPPAKLSAMQYDRATGLVKWPDALQTEPFSGDRKGLEDLLVTRAHTGESSAVDRRIHDSALQMQARLKGQIRDLPPQSYLDSRKFLDLLAAETRQTGSL